MGAGGFAREVLDVVHAINQAQPDDPPWEPLGFVADEPPADPRPFEAIGMSWLGAVDDYLDRDSLSFAVGVGDGSDRLLLADRCSALGHEPATLIHPQAAISTGTEINTGSVVCAFVGTMPDVSVGKFCVLNLHVTVGAGCLIGDGVTINPGAHLGDNISIGHRVMVGTGAFISSNLAVGSAAAIGAGAVVKHDVPGDVTVMGVPAHARMN